MLLLRRSWLRSPILIAFLFLTHVTMSFKLSAVEMQRLMQRVQALSAPKTYMNELLEFHVRDTLVGYCSPSFAKTLISFPRTFMMTEDRRRVRFVPEVDQLDLAGRTAAAHEVSLVLKDEGIASRWRGEMMEVSSRAGGPPLLLLERAVVPFFGTKAYGCHVNGFVRDCRTGAISSLWVGKRSRSKSTWPGMLDHIAAGGLPSGVAMRENVVKECQEEADIPPSLSQRAEETSALSYCALDEDGNLKRDTIHCYDLELPTDFQPRPVDGEVETFMLKPLRWVLNRMVGAEGDQDETNEDRVLEYKPNCHLVLIDFFLRHNLIDENSPHWDELCAMCRHCQEMAGTGPEPSGLHRTSELTSGDGGAGSSVDC